MYGMHRSAIDEIESVYWLIITTHSKNVDPTLGLCLSTMLSQRRSQDQPSTEALRISSVIAAS